MTLFFFFLLIGIIFGYKIEKLPKEFSGSVVSISGRNMIVGNVRKNQVHFFRQDKEKNWIKHQTINGSLTFGCSVSISESYAIVGALYDEEKVERSGAAFFYELNQTSGNWDFKNKVKSDQIKENSRFGFAVAIEKSGYAVIGASGDYDEERKPVLKESGLVYFYQRNHKNGIWEFQNKVIGDNTGPSDWFGEIVSIWKDRAIIGIGRNGDFVYSFKLNKEKRIWEQHQRIDGDGDIKFGTSISVNDGKLFIGAIDDRNEHGSVFIYDLEVYGDWSFSSKIFVEDERDEFFGKHVRFMNGFLIIGSNYVYQNAVYLFKETTKFNPGQSGWKRILKITPEELYQEVYSFSMSTDSLVIGLQSVTDFSPSNLIVKDF